MSEIFQIFSSLENKIIAYRKLSKLVTKAEKHIEVELSKKIEFSIIEDYVFRFNNAETVQHLNFLKSEIEQLLFNDTLIKRIATHDDNELEFGNIESAHSNIKTELNNYYIKLNEYLDYITKRQSYNAIPKNKTEVVKLESNNIFELKESIVNKLAILEFDNKSVFDKNNYEGLLNNINCFITGDFELISPKLNFNVSNKNYAYYLIHSIQSHSNFSLNQIEKITINGVPFTAKNCSKAMVEINKKERKNTKPSNRFFIVKNAIDSIIKENRQKIK